MEKILVLGGFGFLGKNLVPKIKSGSVSVASRQTGLDLLKLELVKEILKSIKPDLIFNCAAHVGSLHYVTQFCGDVIKDNIQMNLNLYEAVKEICPKVEIINPLSNCSYPGDANIHYEPDWFNGPVHSSVLAYGNSKRVIYLISDCYKNQYGIKTKNFLVPNAFGPHDYTDPNKVHALNGMIIRMLQAQKKGEKTFEIWGSGNPIREWGYIDDIANILLLGSQLDADLTYPVNMAQNKGFKIKESAEIIAELIEFEGEIIYNTKYQDGASFKILDDQKFRKLFPTYQFADHKESIRETIKYYKKVLF